MYNKSMKTISVSEARKNLRNVIDATQEYNEVFVIERREKEEAVVMKFPSEYSASINDITNINTYSSSFDFLIDEPDLYTPDDVKKSL